MICDKCQKENSDLIKIRKIFKESRNGAGACSIKNYYFCATCVPTDDNDKIYNSGFICGKLIETGVYCQKNPK